MTSLPDRSEPAPLAGRHLAGAVGLGVVFSAVVGGATAGVAQWLAPEWAASGGRLAALITGEVYAVVPVALVVGLGPQARAHLALRRISLGNVLLCAAAVLAAYAAVAPVQAALAPSSWRAAWGFLLGVGSDDGRLATAGPGLVIVILVRACILAPLAEEMLFRGGLFTWLRQRRSAWVTVLLTACAHALIHGLPAVFPLVVALGIGLGWVRERSGSIVPGVIVHGLNNAVLVAVSDGSTGWTARLPWR
jgi:membrane protease YdiL (CAAX protease family)